MKTISIPLAIASLAGFPAVSAWAYHDDDHGPEQGPYIGLEAGWNSVSNQGVRENGDEPGNLHFNDGFLAGIVGGYAFDNGVRPELEFSHRRNKIDGTVPASPPGSITGFENNDSVFANLWYDLPMAPRVHPYLGGGIGGSRVDARVTGGAAGSGDFDTVFAWQGGAGIGFDVAPHVRLSADWRYIHTSSAKIEQPSLFVPAGGEANYMGNSAGLSLKFCFGRTPTYHAAAAPVHTSYAPPAPPPQPRDVTLRTVNFQFDSADLTPAAKQTLDDIARTLTQQPSLRLQVEGATDSIGSEQYNQQLSERRANAVRDYLVSKGVSPGQLTTIGVDANKPVASNETPEGRAENRRAEFAPMEAAPPDIRLEVRGPTPESTREAEQQAPGHPPDPGEKK